jgi:NADPH:quinone reductase-like Zn-dependent oxidoreductase
MIPSGKAFIYGSSNFVWCEEYRLKNNLGAKEVLIETAHAALNPIDYKVPDLLPFWLLFKGQPIGHDVCGKVIAIGSSVTEFKVGDVVFGVAPACSEYTITTQDKIAKVPKQDLEKSGIYASLPGSGCTALYMLERSGVLGFGGVKKIVVIGASGGVGSCIVQIAKNKLPPGSEIIGVCSPHSAEYVLSIGATQVVDYTAADFKISDAIEVRSVDAVFDTVTSPDDPDYVTEGLKLLKTSKLSRYIAANTKHQSEWLRAGVARQTGWNILSTRKQYELIMVNQSQQYLLELAQLVEKGLLKINIHKEVAFTESEILEAFSLLRKRHVRGKVIIRIKTRS